MARRMARKRRMEPMSAADETTDRKKKTTTWVLWGFHPAGKGQDGYPYPVPLASGSMRECNGERRRRERDGGWTMAVYAKGAPPTGLRLQCDEIYPERSHLGEVEYETGERKP